MGTTTLATAEDVAELLRRGELFTDIAVKLAGGRDITAEIWDRSGPEPMSGEERLQLQAWRDRAGSCCRRTGLLRAEDGDPVAYVAAAWIPQRLPPGVQQALELTDIPLGRALAEAGGVRECLRARVVSDAGIAVRSRGRLLLPGEEDDMVPVALAWEEIPKAVLAGVSWG